MNYKYIINPVTNRKVSVNSKLGKSIIKTYINTMKGGVHNATSFLPSGTPRFWEMMEDGWSSVIKSYDDLKDGKVPAGQEEYWMIRAQFEEELNQVILQILSVDEDGDHFDVTDEFGYDNLESRLKKWYSEYLPSEEENYRPGMTISQKSDDLLTRMTGNVEGDLDALYNYPDHRVIAFLIIDQRDYLDDESSREEQEFWTETMDTEFVEPYKQLLLDIVRGEPMVKAAVVAMPRDS